MIELLAVWMLVSAPQVDDETETRRLVETLERYAVEERERWQVPGLALAVVRDGSLLLAAGYGVRQLGDDGAVDADTLFAIGSTTKAMTAASAGLSIERGLADWDSPVRDILPALRFNDAYVEREVTIRDLLTHRAGLGNADLIWYGTACTRDEILARVPLIPPAYSLRAGFVYQNIMYVAAGQVAAALAGTSWEDLVRTQLFAPLEMLRTVPTTSEAQRADNVARPHGLVDGEVVEVPNEDLDALAPAGAVWSSVRDMSRWLRMLLAEGQWQGRQVLQSETVAELLRPQTLIRDAPYPYLPALGSHWTSYGLGFFQLDYHGHFCCFHTGSIDGMSAIVGVFPDDELGVVVLANLDHAEMRHGVLWKAADLFLGVETEHDWSRELFEARQRQLTESAERDAAGDAQRVAGTTPSLALEAYCGDYEDPLYGTAKVRLVDGALRLELGPRRHATLKHWHYDTFRATFDRRLHGTTSVRFELGEAGTARAAWMFGREFQRASQDQVP